MEPTHLQYLEEILSSKYACDHLTGYQQETIDALAELLSYCPYERLCELAQADKEDRVLPEGSGWFVTCSGKKLTVVMDIEAALRREQDG